MSLNVFTVGLEGDVDDRFQSASEDLLNIVDNNKASKESLTDAVDLICRISIQRVNNIHNLDFKFVIDNNLDDGAQLVSMYNQAIVFVSDQLTTRKITELNVADISMIFLPLKAIDLMIEAREGNLFDAILDSDIRMLKLEGTPKDLYQFITNIPEEDIGRRLERFLIEREGVHLDFNVLGDELIFVGNLSKILAILKPRLSDES